MSGELLPPLFTLSLISYIRWFFSAALSLELPPTEVIRYHFLHELRLSSSNELKAIARYPKLIYIKKLLN